MTTLNKRAAEVITGGDFRVNAMTDVTGFGLMGHAREMVLASDVSVRIFAGRVPLLDGAMECVRAGYVPAGLNNNREFAECLVEYDQGGSRRCAGAAVRSADSRRVADFHAGWGTFARGAQ